MCALVRLSFRGQHHAKISTAGGGGQRPTAIAHLVRSRQYMICWGLRKRTAALPWRSITQYYIGNRIILGEVYGGALTSIPRSVVGLPVCQPNESRQSRLSTNCSVWLFPLVKALPSCLFDMPPAPSCGIWQKPAYQPHKGNPVPPVVPRLMLNGMPTTNPAAGVAVVCC